MVYKKQIWFLVLGSWFLVNLLGCAPMKEVTKGLAGVSTKVLEDTRKDAIKESFIYSYNTCYEKTKEALKTMGCYIYAEEPEERLIAIYISETDTTPVGIFFKEIESNTTQIEVSSPSTFAKELISQRLFNALSPKKKGRS